MREDLRVTVGYPKKDSRTSFGRAAFARGVGDVLTFRHLRHAVGLFLRSLWSARRRGK